MTVPRRRRLAHRAETSYLVYVRIGGPARNHHIADTDILHAARHANREVPRTELARRTPDNFTMLIGPARNGAHLEIGVLDLDGDDPVIIHADNLRPRFYKFL
jgi:hypothetical protein